MAPSARSPHVHKFITQLIMADAPPNDSDLMPAPRHVANPRHRDLADECRVLLDWRRLSNPNGGTWIEPANDNISLAREGFRPGVEAELEQRPSPEELERAWQKVGADAALRLRRKDSFGTPYGPDDRDREDRQKADRKLAIAALKCLLAYVQGEPVEAAEPHDPHFAPTITQPPETAEKRALRDLAASLGVGREVSLEGARARWNLPPVANDNEPAFPWRPADPREIFYTGRIRGNPRRTKPGKFNDGVSSADNQRLEFAHLRGKLSRDTVKALDIAIEARNFAEVGAAFGYQDKKAAERRGKKLVKSACDELKAVLAKG